MGSKPTTKRRRSREKVKRRAPIGAPPGTMIADPTAHRPEVRIMAYGPDGVVERTLERAEQIREFIEGPSRRPVVWIDVAGLGDAATIAAIGEMLHLHKLALEDVINIHQRPKVDMFPGAIFLVARVVEPARADAAGEPLTTDQLSLFLGEGYVLTF